MGVEVKSFQTVQTMWLQNQSHFFEVAITRSGKTPFEPRWNKLFTGSANFKTYINAPLHQGLIYGFGKSSTIFTALVMKVYRLVRLSSRTRLRQPVKPPIFIPEKSLLIDLID